MLLACLAIPIVVIANGTALEITASNEEERLCNIDSLPTSGFYNEMSGRMDIVPTGKDLLTHDKCGSGYLKIISRVNIPSHTR